MIKNRSSYESFKRLATCLIHRSEGRFCSHRYMMAGRAIHEALR
jgi:hypothetical protein